MIGPPTAVQHPGFGDFPVWRRLGPQRTPLVSEQAFERADRLANLLASIVESSDDVIVSKNLDGIVTSWNKAAERVFGYSASEAIGQPITLVIPEGPAKRRK
jgi:PAS domain-containing protein